MSPDQVVQLCRHLILEVLLLSAPILLAGLLASLAITVLQTLTSLQDQTLSTVPRLLFAFAAGALLLPWMTRHAITYTLQLWSNFHHFLD